VPHGLGNIYGEDKYPIDQLKLGKKGRRVKSQEHIHRDENMAAEEEWLVPGPSHAYQDKVSAVSDTIPPSNHPNPAPGDDENHLIDIKGNFAYLCCEGRVQLFNYLIKFAHSPNDTEINELTLKHEPDLAKVQEWQYKDIARIKDQDVQKDFECACQEELEALW